MPVVTVGAPIGAWLASHAHRRCLAAIVITADVVQFVIGMWILFSKRHGGGGGSQGGEPQPQTALVATTAAIVLGGGGSSSR